MKKLILFVVVLGLATVVAPHAEAGIFGCRRATAPTYTRAAPVATATARVDQGYRAFSYEPGATVVPAAAVPVIRTYRTERRMQAWDYQKTDARRYNGGN
jgi:hypothetical protein